MASSKAGRNSRRAHLFALLGGALTACAATLLPPSAIASMSKPMPKPMSSIAPGQAMPAPMGGSYLSQVIPSKILNISLQAADGHKFTLASLKGKTVLITNFLTSCQEICPMTTANMQKIADKVDAAKASKDVVILEITVDPLRDTPARMKAYQALFGSTNWTLATGSTIDVSALWNYFGAPATRQAFSADELKTMPKDWQTGKANAYDMVHSDLVIALDKQSRWVWLDLGSPKTSDGKVPSILKKYLTADGLRNLAKPEEPSWSVATAVAALAAISQLNIQ